MSHLSNRSYTLSILPSIVPSYLFYALDFFTMPALYFPFEAKRAQVMPVQSNLSPSAFVRATIPTTNRQLPELTSRAHRFRQHSLLHPSTSMIYQAASSDADASPSRPDTTITTPELTPPPTPQELQENIIKEYATLRVHAINTATTYRNLGILYHSLPPEVIFDNHMAAPARSFARLEFTIIDYRELPWMIQSIGVMDYALRQASAALRGAAKPEDFERVDRKLLMVAMWLRETNVELLWLQGIMAEYVELRALKLVAGGLGAKEQEKTRNQGVVKDAWSDALPSICRETFSEKEREIWDMEEWEKVEGRTGESRAGS